MTVLSLLILTSLLLTSVHNNHCFLSDSLYCPVSQIYLYNL